MKWAEIKIVFEHDNPQAASELIADAFYSFGVTGVVMDEPEEHNPDDWENGIVKGPENFGVAAYFPVNERLNETLDGLKQALEALEEEIGITYAFYRKDIDEQDWAESWKTYFWPEHITDSIVVKPTWRKYDPKPGEMILELDPGMAFGTGAHPTTAQCVVLLEKYIQKGDMLLDVGCGSGILMVAALLLGAGHVTGTDNDPVAVEVAIQNLILNRMEKDRFSVFENNLAKGLDRKFDVVVANILTDVILLLLDDIRDVLKPGGLFITSGIIEKNRHYVLDKMERMEFSVVEIRNMKDWAAIAGRLTLK